MLEIKNRTLKNVFILTCGSVLALSLAGCGSNDAGSSAAKSSSSATQSTTANSDKTPAATKTADSNKSTGDTDKTAGENDKADNKPGVEKVDKETADGSRKPLDPATVASSCTGEGTYYIKLGSSAADPELPAMEGKKLTLTYESSWQKDGNVAVAHFQTQVDNETPQPLDVPLGEIAHVGAWQFTPTSICKDNVEVDVINQ